MWEGGGPHLSACADSTWFFSLLFPLVIFDLIRALEKEGLSIKNQTVARSGSES